MQLRPVTERASFFPATAPKLELPATEPAESFVKSDDLRLEPLFTAGFAVSRTDGEALILDRGGFKIRADHPRELELAEAFYGGGDVSTLPRPRRAARLQQLVGSGTFPDSGDWGYLHRYYRQSETPGYEAVVDRALAHPAPSSIIFQDIENGVRPDVLARKVEIYELLYQQRNELHTRLTPNNLYGWVNSAFKELANFEPGIAEQVVNDVKAWLPKIGWTQAWSRAKQLVKHPEKRDGFERMAEAGVKVAGIPQQRYFEIADQAPDLEEGARRQAEYLKLLSVNERAWQSKALEKLWESPDHPAAREDRVEALCELNRGGLLGHHGLLTGENPLKTARELTRIAEPLVRAGAGEKAAALYQAYQQDPSAYPAFLDYWKETGEVASALTVFQGSAPVAPAYREVELPKVNLFSKVVEERFTAGPKKWFFNSAVGADGTVVGGTGNEGYIALAADGTIRWSQPHDGPKYDAVVAGPEGRFHFNGGVYNRRGALQFKAPGPAVFGPQGMLYANGGGSAYTADGELLFSGAGWGGDLLHVAPDGGLVAVDSKAGRISKTSASGEVLWEHPGTPYGRLSMNKFSAVGPGGQVAFRDGEEVVILDGDDGRVARRVEVEFGTVGPAFDQDGRLFCSHRDGKLFAFTPEGEPLWQRELGARGDYFSPLVLEDGTVVVSVNDGDLVGFDSAGNRAWSIETTDAEKKSPVGEPLLRAPVKGPDGLISQTLNNGMLLRLVRVADLRQAEAPSVEDSDVSIEQGEDWIVVGDFDLPTAG